MANKTKSTCSLCEKKDATHMALCTDCHERHGRPGPAKLAALLAWKVTGGERDRSIKLPKSSRDPW